MTPRTRRLLVALPVTVALALAVAWLVWPRTAITRENAAKIQPGMTLAEVEAILGAARDEKTGSVEPDVDADVDAKRRFEEHEAIIGIFSLFGQRATSFLGATTTSPRSWQSDRVLIIVMFDADWCVTESIVCPMRCAPESLIDKLRRWLRL
jgi:hypothetical protein